MTHILSESIHLSLSKAALQKKASFVTVSIVNAKFTMIIHHTKLETQTDWDQQ